MIYKTLHWKLKIEQHELIKTRGELICSGRVSSSSSTSDTRLAKRYEQYEQYFRINSWLEQAYK